jgi:hypothetical protein
MMKLFLHVVFLSAADMWGWLGVALLAVLIAIPYFRTRGLMQVHYWLAPAVAIVSLIHAWIPMSSGHMPQTSMNGLWLATYSLGALFLQLLVGLLTRYVGPQRAAAMRRVHFALMLIVVVLLASHLWMNG